MTDIAPQAGLGHDAPYMVHMSGHVAALGKPARVMVASAIFFVLATLSIEVSRIPGLLALIWLPNPLAIVLIMLYGPRHLAPTLIGLGVGITLANLVTGDPLQIALALALINVLQVHIAVQLAARILRGRLPHANEMIYLRFLFAIVVPVSALTGVLGACLLAVTRDAPFLQVLWNWVIGEGISLATLIPPLLWLFGRRLPEASGRPGQGLVIAGGLVAISCSALLTVRYQEPMFLFPLCPLLAILALRIGRTATIHLTALMLAVLTLQTALDQTLLSNEFGAGAASTVFAVLFFCVVAPANLIASMIGRLVETEERERRESEVKSRFISTMSHEIRTPLNAINGVFELLQLKSLPEKEASWVRAGLKASHVLKRQVEEILDLDRLGNQSLSMNPEPVEIIQMAENWRTMISADIRGSEKPLGLELQIDCTLPRMITIDADRLTQVVINLGRNAVKFSESGTIALALGHVDNALQIQVTDQGCGITPADQKRIFERFWQAQSDTRKKLGGTGLGLSIAQEIVTLLHGTISVDSQPGRGTVFQVTVPFVP